MILLRVLVVFFVICLAKSGQPQKQQYQLEFDWKINTRSTDIEVCTVTWNDGILITLKELIKPNRRRHTSIALDFK